MKYHLLTFVAAVAVAVPVAVFVGSRSNPPPAPEQTVVERPVPDGTTDELRTQLGVLTVRVNTLEAELSSKVLLLTLAEEQVRGYRTHLYGSGILAGLGLTPSADKTSVVVSPGVAVDKTGRCILLKEPRTLPVVPGPDGKRYVAISYGDGKSPTIEIVDEAPTGGEKLCAGQVEVAEGSVKETRYVEPGGQHVRQEVRVVLETPSYAR